MRIIKKILNIGTIVFILFGLFGFVAGASVTNFWIKSEVVPVVLVKPGVLGFEPTEGSSIGNNWSKSKVTPVVLVKPWFAGFEPHEGSSFGNSWSKSNVTPVMLVEPSKSGFIPKQILSSYENPKKPSKPQHEKSPKTEQPSVIESQIDGDFEGWEGETIVKLMNGQIWQQTEYYYRYHYSFMPKVLIIKSGGSYKMKVDGIEKLIRVQRLR